MTIKHRYLFLLLFFSFACKTTRERLDATRVEVLVTLTTTSSYCGGARPPEGLEEELRTPKAFGYEKLYVRQGSRNDVRLPLIDSCVTDEAGKAVFRLAAGQYCIVMEEKANWTVFEKLLEQYKTETTYWNAIDRACLEEWLRTPELLIEVGPDKTTSYSLNHHKPCPWREVPCANYKGPYPP
jgi:hypothetical protein